MAPWQFMLKIIPVAGLLRIHGEIPKKIEAVRFSIYSSVEDLDLLLDTIPDYWCGQLTKTQVESKLSSLLPSTVSWSESARMFGESKKDSFEIWGNTQKTDRVTLSFSLSEPNIDFMKKAIAIVRESDCVFLDAQSNDVFNASVEEFIVRAEMNSASRFLPDHFSLSEMLKE